MLRHLVESASGIGRRRFSQIPLKDLPISDADATIVLTLKAFWHLSDQIFYLFFCNRLIKFQCNFFACVTVKLRKQATQIRKSSKNYYYYGLGWIRKNGWNSAGAAVKFQANPICMCTLDTRLFLLLMNYIWISIPSVVAPLDIFHFNAFSLPDSGTQQTRARKLRMSSMTSKITPIHTTVMLTSKHRQPGCKTG